MSDFVPTPSQKEAMEARGGALLVSAGAGSGKTKVLTQRLMRYILDREHPQNTLLQQGWTLSDVRGVEHS